MAKKNIRVDTKLTDIKTGNMVCYLFKPENSTNVMSYGGTNTGMLGIYEDGNEIALISPDILLAVYYTNKDDTV